MIKRPRPTAVRSLAKFSLFSLAILCFYLYTLTLPVGKNPLTPFQINKGESVTQIASNLKSQHLIRSPLYFRFIVQRHDLTLQAGSYQLDPSLSPIVLAKTLTKGFASDKKITIPEGFRAEQIAETAGLPVKEFLVSSNGLEGQLFPDTYFVKEGITSAELVKTLHDNFRKKVGEIDKTTLILASLVERETKGNAEKPVVAGILKKRLAAGWALELDATVQYVLGKSGNWWPNTTLLDRKIKSPFNTYLHPGLPPAPIGNPGLSSINAVRASQDSPYWFYLHDREGNIRYASTLEEHNQNIAKYIK